MKKQYPMAKCLGGSWTLEKNDVWNIPDGVHEVRGEMETVGMWSICHHYSALAVDRDGYVYGIRSLSKPRESGYVLEGRVSIDGKSYRAFTSSKLFQRGDGSLCDVAILYVCMPDDRPIPLPDLDTAPDEVLKELTHKYHHTSHDSRSLICEYARIKLGLRGGWDIDYPHVGYPARLEETYNELPEWAKFRGR